MEIVKSQRVPYLPSEIFEKIIAEIVQADMLLSNHPNDRDTMDGQTDYQHLRLVSHQFRDIVEGLTSRFTHGNIYVRGPVPIESQALGMEAYSAYKSVLQAKLEPFLKAHQPRQLTVHLQPDLTSAH